MKVTLKLLRVLMICTVAPGIAAPVCLAAATEDTPDAPAATTAAAIPWAGLGAKAGADYKGDGLDVIPTTGGARLRCIFQRLEGEATREGLWLTSTATNAVTDRFRLVATETGRVTPAGSASRLLTSGSVSVEGECVRFIRSGLVEEYTVSMDGVRQDFVVLERPAGAGELVVRLAVSGAGMEPAAFGAQLVLENSGRRIAYSRLRVTDATGRELAARLVTAAPRKLAVVVNDAEAMYPVRIDPTFSDANWISMGGVPGANDRIYAAATDGSGNLYIGGEFTVVGDVVANHIAKWNGSRWSALGAGTDLPVYALVVSGSKVYAAGSYFAPWDEYELHFIAEWNGSGWAQLGSGINGQVNSLAVSGSDLYAGGRFTTAGGNAATNIARWDGSTWSPVGSGVGGVDSWVNALAVSGSDVFAGGFFTAAGGIPANYIAKWNGSSWSALGSGMDWLVIALTVSGNELYAGGRFATAGGSAANNIAKWDGSNWSALAGGREAAVYALAVSGSDVYAGGEPPSAFDANPINKWNGSSWSALGPGVLGSVGALAVSGGDLYAVGGRVEGSTANGITKWNGSNWSALGSGTDGPMRALAVSGGELYAGGYFTTVGGIKANGIAKWDGINWSALGSGINGGVLALAVSGSNVYAVGSFTMAGGIEARNIAKWDGSNWSALGSGLNSFVSASSVSALAVSGSDVYAGGAFTTAGSSAATNIARWDGTNWTALGAGIPKAQHNSVRALAVSGSNVYAGGHFGIAKWNGSSWTELGAGMIGGVYALAVSGSDLYAGGAFTMVDGIVANGIAKWNGSSWSALGSQTVTGGRGVFALAVSGSNVYAGGEFTALIGSDIPANRIAKWDGSSWSAMGSGMNHFVYALAVSGSDLYAGGDFTIAGGKASGYIARASLPLPALSIHRSGTAITLSWPTAGSAGFALEQSHGLSGPEGWIPNSAAVTDDGTNKSVTIPAAASRQFFRLRGP
jgi:hypothetical protein